MKKYDKLCYANKIRWRIRISWAILIFMLIYMIIVGETGGDSRIMTGLAASASRTIFFGGLIYVIYRIYFNKKLLKNRKLLQEKKLLEQDERNQYIHDKSGGIVMDMLLLILLFTTMTSSLFNMAAFYVSITILTTAVCLKAIAYVIYSHK